MNETRVNITGVDSKRSHHIVAAVRHRDEFNIILRHTHCGTTLCGQAVQEILPYFPINIPNCCDSCVDIYFEKKSEAVTPSTVESLAGDEDV